MSKADYEVWVTRKGRRHGKPYAERRRLQVPFALATGRYEQLSDLALREAINDLTAEQATRSGDTPQALQYDPAQSQIRRPSPEENA